MQAQCPPQVSHSHCHPPSPGQGNGAFRRTWAQATSPRPAGGDQKPAEAAPASGSFHWPCLQPGSFLASLSPGLICDSFGCPEVTSSRRLGPAAVARSPETKASPELHATPTPSRRKQAQQWAPEATSWEAGHSGGLRQGSTARGSLTVGAERLQGRETRAHQPPAEAPVWPQPPAATSLLPSRR